MPSLGLTIAVRTHGTSNERQCERRLPRYIKRKWQSIGTHSRGVAFGSAPWHEAEPQGPRLGLRSGLTGRPEQTIARITTGQEREE